MTNTEHMEAIRARIERYKKALLGSNNKFELFNARTELETHCFSDLTFLLEMVEDWRPECQEIGR